MATEGKAKGLPLRKYLRFCGEWHICCGRLQHWPERIRYGKEYIKASEEEDVRPFVEWLMDRKGMTRAQAETYIRETDQAIREWEHNAMMAERCRNKKKREGGTVKA